MTNVNYAARPAVPAQATAQLEADPPTIKNAGKLAPYESSAAVVLLPALIFGLLAVGAMLQAVLTNQGRNVRGAIINVVAGAAALALAVGTSAAYYENDTWEVLFWSIGPFGFAWLVLAVLAFGVGSIVQPPGKAAGRRR